MKKLLIVTLLSLSTVAPAHAGIYIVLPVIQGNAENVLKLIIKNMESHGYDTTDVSVTTTGKEGAWYSFPDKYKYYAKGILSTTEGLMYYWADDSNNEKDMKLLIDTRGKIDGKH